jgi:segregation and condensation protein A
VETETFKIKTTNFEGPFGLLLDLVEKRKLHINDLSLAAVTEEYLNHVKSLGGLPMSQVSSFIYVASTLLLIKSKSLLPGLDLTNEEEGDIKSLEERLRLYEIITNVSKTVQKQFGKRIIFSPLERKRDVLVFLPDSQITPERMMTLAREVLDAVPKPTHIPEVEVKKVISIEEMVDRLTERVKNTLKFSFKDFHGKGKPTSRAERVEVIVGFLAMLELVRQGIMDAVQESDEIILERISETTREV